MIFAPWSDRSVFKKKRKENGKSKRGADVKYSTGVFLMCICPTSFLVEHESGANSVNKDESLFLRAFFFFSLFSESQKRLHFTKRKKNSIVLKPVQMELDLNGLNSLLKLKR